MERRRAFLSTRTNTGAAGASRGCHSPSPGRLDHLRGDYVNHAPGARESFQPRKLVNRQASHRQGKLAEVGEKVTRLATGIRRLHAQRGSGFTIIELAVATSILMVGLVAIASASSNMHSLRKLTRERVMAQNAMRSVAERIHARSFGLSNTAPTEWVSELIAVYGPEGRVGEEFAVTGLTPIPGATNVGTIEILTDETLEDDLVGYELGLPRDLNLSLIHI